MSRIPIDYPENHPIYNGLDHIAMCVLRMRCLSFPNSNEKQDGNRTTVSSDLYICIFLELDD